jgi:hypothetical protein
MVFAGMVNDPECVETPVAMVCSLLRPSGLELPILKSIVDGSEEPESHAITIGWVGSTAAPGRGEKMVNAEAPERKTARLPKERIERRIRERTRVGRQRCQSKQRKKFKKAITAQYERMDGTSDASEQTEQTEQN